MNSKVTFFPIGNADTTLIQLGSGKNILWDYANRTGEKNCNLPFELNHRINKDYYDVVCFTHADEDHIKGLTGYFHLLHDKKYQSDTALGKRKEILELWVPAAIIVDDVVNNEDDGALTEEARYRFLTLRKGIKVFSRPKGLRKWVEERGVDFDSVRHLIINAGDCVPGWTKEVEGAEFFALSPFMGHVDNYKNVDRNRTAITVQVTFGNTRNSKMMLGSDINSDVWEDIIKITQLKNNHIEPNNRLAWDIFHTSHHCSYCSLNKDDRGSSSCKTPTIAEVRKMFEVYGRDRGIIVIPSNPIPVKCGEEITQPLHKEAYKYYKEDVPNKTVEVTMEYPSKEKPEPLEILISDEGVAINRKNNPATVFIKESTSNPRVG